MEASLAQIACGSVSKPVCQSFAELHLTSVVRDGVPQNSEIKSRQGTSMMVPPFLFPSLECEVLVS